MQGLPFVGRAGKLLTQMIEAMGLRREQVYIANIVKCRPPENRAPQEDEVAACMPFLLRQIAAIGPQVIVCLGSTAAQNLLGTKKSISHFRGQWFDLHGAKADRHLSSRLPAAQSQRETRRLDRLAKSHGHSWIGATAPQIVARTGLKPHSARNLPNAAREVPGTRIGLPNISAMRPVIYRCCYTSASAWPAIAKSPFLFRCARRLLTACRMPSMIWWFPVRASWFLFEIGP